MRLPLGALNRLGRVPKIAPILAILDQAIYALTNLGLQIILARSVSQNEFGAYSVASAFFFIAALVHSSFIIEPMFVFTAQRYSECAGAYHKRLRRGWSVAFSVITIIVGLTLAVGMWALGSVPLAKTVAAFAVVSPVLLYLWLLRRMAFLLGRIEIAILGGAVYSLSLSCGAAVVWKLGQITASSAIGLSGLAAVIASVVVTVAIRWTPSQSAPPADIFQQHLRYGRWAVSSETVNWLIFNGPIAMIPIWHGLAAAAQLRVLNLIFMPLLQVVMAITYLLLGRFASTVREGQEARTAFEFLGLLAVGAAVYSAVIVALGPELAAITFGRDISIEARWLVLGALSMTCFVAAQGLVVALRAREKANQVLIVHGAVLMIMVALLPLVIVYGVTGILLAQTIAWGAAIAGASALVLRLSAGRPLKEPVLHADLV